MDNIRLFLPIIVLELILKAVALMDLARRSNAGVKGGRRWPWLLGILFVSTIGPVVYLAWGRDDTKL